MNRSESEIDKQEIGEDNNMSNHQILKISFSNGNEDINK